MDEREAVAAMRIALGIKDQPDEDFGILNLARPAEVYISVDHARHGEPPQEPLAVWAYRAIGAALSDIACSGANFTFVQLDLQIPSDGTTKDVEAIGGGIGRALKRYGAELLNGNNTTLNHDGPFRLTTVVHGFRPSDCPRPPGRSGAQVGDVVACSRLPGQFNSALRLLNCGAPAKRDTTLALLGGQAELAAGRALVGSGRVTAMIDLNDCLLLGASDLAKASGVKIDLDVSAISAMGEAIGLTVDDVLSPPSGDLALLFTVHPNAWDEVRQSTEEQGGSSAVQLGWCGDGSPGVAVGDWSSDEIAVLMSRHWRPTPDFKYPAADTIAALEDIDR